MKTSTSLPIEEVVWEDHYSTTEWAGREDAVKENDGLFVTSIGYRLKETKQKILLVQNLADNDQISGTMTILKKTVAKRTIIREAQ